MSVEPFRAFDAALSSDQVVLLKEASKELFTAKQKAKRGRYSTGDTYFVKASEEPNSIAELYALAVFRWFTNGLSFDPQCAGAEYWPLVLDGSSDEVGAHYDKDYAGETDGEDLYPLVGTVTYLSDHGAPTTFFEMLESTSRASPTCSVPRAWISRVQSGKIVAFDGRFLHCAPSALANIWGMPKPNAGPRVTLLVNVWFHTPRDALRSPFQDPDVKLIGLPMQIGTPNYIPIVKCAEGTEISIDLGDGKSCLDCKIDTYAIVNTKKSCAEVIWQSDGAIIHKKEKKKKEKKQRKNKRRGGR